MRTLPKDTVGHWRSVGTCSKETSLRRIHSEEVFQGETFPRRPHSKKENQNIPGGCMSLEKREVTPDPQGGLGITGSRKVTFCSPHEC